MTSQLFNIDDFEKRISERGLPVPITRPEAQPPHAAEGTQADLIRRAIEGDRDAFYELVRPNERMIFSAALSILRNEEDAEEVTQDAVLKALVHLQGFRGDCKFGTWLVQIVINESRMRLRKRNARVFESIEFGVADEDGDRMPLEIADTRALPSKELETRELREHLRKAILELPEIYRDVFVLRDVNDLSIAETARALKISEASVKTRLLRARLKMQEALSEFRMRKQ